MDVVRKLIINYRLEEEIWYLYLVFFKGLEKFHDVCGRSYIDQQ